MLRPYQKQLIEQVRQAYKHNKNVCMQLPTGGGKTHIFTEIARLAHDKHNVWILVPRRELIFQASDKLEKIGVDHGIIAPGYDETEHSVHIVSKDTLVRRYDKIKKPPTLIIVDEAHIALDRYVEISNRYRDAYLLGVTATPERLDGRGLSELYSELVCGPSLSKLVDNGYLCDAEFYCPPIDGLGAIKRTGTEYDAGELHNMMTSNEIYGKAVKHYADLTPSRPALVYCRSIEASKQIAAEFEREGFDFRHIDGGMNKKQRDE